MADRASVRVGDLLGVWFLGWGYCWYPNSPEPLSEHRPPQHPGTRFSRDSRCVLATPRVGSQGVPDVPEPPRNHSVIRPERDDPWRVTDEGYRCEAHVRAGAPAFPAHPGMYMRPSLAHGVVRKSAGRPDQPYGSSRRTSTRTNWLPGSATP